MLTILCKLYITALVDSSKETCVSAVINSVLLSWWVINNEIRSSLGVIAKLQPTYSSHDVTTYMHG